MFLIPLFHCILHKLLQLLAVVELELEIEVVVEVGNKQVGELILRHKHQLAVVEVLILRKKAPDCG